MPTDVLFGDGALDALPDVAVLRAAGGVALLTGRRALHDQGILSRLGRLLPKRVRHIEGVPPRPQPQDLRAIVEALGREDCDAIVAAGGGSVIDVAKGVAFCLRRRERDAEPVRDVPEVAIREVAVVAVPTTAGTGSEVTPFATFWDRESRRKLSLDDPSLFPDAAVVDPCLTLTMPPELTASTGMDALTQACEAYWNLNHNATSDGHALLAIALLVEALPRAVRDGRDRDARRAVMRGSLEAGLAFSNTRTTACHSLSYPMTLHYGIPHGQAAGVTLPEVLPLNAAALAPVPGRRGAFCAALGSATIDDVAERIRSMMRECRLATRLGQLGIDEGGVPTIVRDGMRSSRMSNNPYRFTERALRELLLRIL